MGEKPSNNISKSARELKKNKFNVKIADNTREAKDLLLDIIPRDAAVGIGDSTSVRQTDILAELERRGNHVINPFKPEITEQWGTMVSTMRKTLGSNVFLTGSNAVTLDGKIVSTDMAGNRVAGMIFGAPEIILVVGKNKIVPDVDAARGRIKEIIAPYHARAKGRKTPCAKTGNCTDCDAPERLCNATVILEYKPLLANITVILVNEDLGLSWDSSWDKNRINHIKENYHNYTWEIPVPDNAASEQETTLT